jgi:hypothetical protein
MVLSSRSRNPKTIPIIDLGLMGWRKCTTWTTQWSLTIMDCSSTWIPNIQAHSMMSPSCMNLLYTRTNVSYLYTQMSTLSICRVTQDIWGKKCSLCTNLGAANLLLGMIRMQLVLSTKIMQVTKLRRNKGYGDWSTYEYLIPQSPSTLIFSMQQLS